MLKLDQSMKIQCIFWFVSYGQDIILPNLSIMWSSDYDFLKFQTQFVSDTLISALEFDALKNSHPIEIEVGHPSEVEEIFDSISYNKGASVIRMLHNYIGNDAFKQGMKHYLTKHSYKNTQTEDLWASLETASGKPVGKVMTTWTSQMGFPLIHVESRVEAGKKILTLTQEKFNADGRWVKTFHFVRAVLHYLTKGQLVWKGLFGVIVSTKKQMNFFKDFCPSL